MADSDFTHLDESGRAKMVDVGAKQETIREARAVGVIKMKHDTLKAVLEGAIKKGDVLAVAQVAAITAVKKTSDIIPMCHPLRIAGVDVEFNPDEAESSISVAVTVKAIDRTGVEMEALTGVAAALLTIYDMCKALEKDMIIEDIKLLRKTGGKSGIWERS